MADTGWKFPGTMVGNRVLGGTGDWANPDNAKVDDTNTASVTLDNVDGGTNGLAASNFDFSSIPVGAQIDGIEVRAGDSQVNTTGNNPYLRAKVILADDSDSTDFNNTPTLTTSPVTYDLGGASDLWGESISRADLQDVDFGFYLGALHTANGTSHDFDVDFMQMRVFYHVGLPTTINTNAAVGGYSPPFKSSTGNFYVVGPAGAGTLDVFKTADPTTDSWTAQDISANPDGITFYIISSVQDGDLIHIANWGQTGASLEYRYHVFNMADDTWSIIEELIEEPADTPNIPWISIAVRSDGSVVACYAGATDAVMGNDKERVDYNVRNGSWGGPQAFDAAGDVHYGNPNCMLGTNDFVHCVFQGQTDVANDPPVRWDDVQGRSIDPADDSASTVDIISSSYTSTQLLGGQNVVTYDDSGTQRIIAVGSPGASEIRAVRAVEDGSDEIDITAITADFITISFHINGEVAIVSIAELSGDLHALYVDGVSRDIYYTKSTDDAATWLDAAEELDAVTGNFISATVYMRGFHTYLAYVYDDGGVQKYNEKLLITGTGTATGTPSIAKPTSSSNANVWPHVWLNTSESKSGATEMTVTAVNDAGTSITFSDPAGAPTGALYLGVENAAGLLGWIAVTVGVGADETASGTPSIAKPTSAGTADNDPPTVTDVNTTETWNDGDTGLVATGTGFV